MPKHLPVCPSGERAPRELRPPVLPLNAYRGSVAGEAKTYGRQALVDMLHDMMVLREFESMLQAIKTHGEYEGVAYDHKGPAHLSVGQESAAVGQAFLLGVEDHIYGSHRSHGEILAKGLSALRKIPAGERDALMRGYMDGAVLRVVEPLAGGDDMERAVLFLLYGALAEIFGRETGFNRGLGGSMHAFFTPFGIYPNNAIVGGSGDIAAGAALFKRVNRRKGIIVANLGDASLGCGPVWEGINFAAMGQFRTLWEESHRGGLPVLFNFMNNFYGMGGQTSGETMGFDVLARFGLGVNPEALHAERVDGFNPLAVVDAMRRKRELLEQGKGPVLLDLLTYRFSGHSPSDASSYRDREELERWQAMDPLQAFPEALVKARVLSRARVEEMREAIRARTARVCRLAADLEVSPRMDPERIGGFMFSGRVEEALDDRAPERAPPGDNPRVQAIARKVRSAFENGQPVPKNRVFQFRDAVFEAVYHRFGVDPTLVAYGEENRDWGGAFAVYRGLTEALPYHRLFNAPISEGAIVGTAVGYALEGGRALVELMYCDFMGRAGDEIFNQLSKWQSMSAGALRMPVVLRVSVGAKYGAQHSQDWSALCRHIPGLKVVFPVTPYDAKGMMNTALSGTDPVVFFESQRLYDLGEWFEPEVPAGYYTVPFGPPARRREGRDLTLVTIGATLYRALEAAEILQSRYGLSAEVFDCRSINPLDYEPLVESVRKTGRVLVASDACERGSIPQGLAANLGQLAFDSLDAPPVVVGARNWITPCAEQEESFFPQAGWIVDAVHERILPLPGHRPSTNQALGELLRRERLGI